MAAGDLTTLANVQGWLDPTGALVWTVPQQTLLTRLISACSQYIATFTSRTFAAASYTETRNGMNTQRMVLQNQPVVSVTSVTVDGVAIPVRPPLTSLSVTSSQYGYLNDSTSVMLTGCYWFTQGWGNVVIAYTAGYVSVPLDLEQACIDTVGDWYKYKDRIGKLDEAIEQQTIRFTDADFPARAKAIVWAYRQKAPIY